MKYKRLIPVRVESLNCSVKHDIQLFKVRRIPLAQTFQEFAIPRRALLPILLMSFVIIISGIEICHSNMENMVNINMEQEFYIVTEERPDNILSMISASGNRTIICVFDLTGQSEIWGLAIDSYGNFIITEPNKAKLEKVTPAGNRTMIYKFGTIDSPYGVAIDSSGNYIVTESGVNKLSKVTPAGVKTVIYNFAAKTEPRTLAIDSSGNYIITEWITNKLSKVTPAGVRTVICDFGAGGNNGLAGVAIDSSGNYIVTEFYANKLSKVTPDGVRSVIYSFKNDTGPYGVAIDSQGNYIVTELFVNILSKITPTGQRTVIYDWAQALGERQRPAGVAILLPPKVGDLRVTVNDAAGAVISGASVSINGQLNEQEDQSGASTTDGSFTFIRLVPGSYTVQASKSGYSSSSAQGNVEAGKTVEISITLETQASSGIPAFPFAAIVIGVLLIVFWLSFRNHY